MLTVKPEEEDRPYVMSIAGFDPSGGAGILADVKTFETNKVYGLGICSALTFQNDQEFDSVNWVSEEEIMKQMEVLFRRFKPGYIKIGLVQNLEVLHKIVNYIRLVNENCSIIWDPILKASAGFNFHTDINRDLLTDICRELALITPNLEEMAAIFPELSPVDGAIKLSYTCPVLLKGGHTTGERADDVWYEKGKSIRYEGLRLDHSKHGTGCVLSSAILTNLAKGYDL
ncbi:MAG: hydroxymethylpyrimidine/phosphomethylpyrimidine kinase, partial [Cytophagaceae bacterium]